MKASSVRKCAKAYDAAQISEAIEAITEEERELLEVEGVDMEERLTHLLLAARIHAQMADGIALKDAFRDVMGGVRDTLENDA